VPLPAALFTGQVPQTEILDRTGRSLRTVRPGDQPFRRVVEYRAIPQPLIQATLAAEDRRFWRHPGVDWHASLRAAWQVVRHGHVVSGGSTITQQLIKLSTPRPRTLRTKLVEAAQALRLEQVWDKQRILAAYLNRLDYGNFNRGCAAAAEFYFAKPLGDLSPAECALLAGLPQAPSRLNPHSHLARAVSRQHWVLGQMRLAGFLSEGELQRALVEPLRLAPARRTFEAPHFVDLLASVLRLEPKVLSSPGRDASPKRPCDGGGGRLGEASLPCGLETSDPELQTLGPGLKTLDSRLATTLDLDLNRFAEAALSEHLSGLRAQHVSNGAIVVLDNTSGDVLALVGSGDYFAPAGGQVNGAWAPRSPGSALKPFTYLLAFERGATPASVVADVPAEFATASGIFAPVNYDRHCYGPMRYRLALANSLNISAVKVLASIGGPEPLQQVLQRCGLTTLGRPAESYGLGLTIGNAEVRLLELANAYACLARLGEYKPYRLLARTPRGGVSDLAAVDASARRPYPGPDTQTSKQVADPAAAYLIADILSDNAARALAFGPESPLRFEFPVACKTGTSSDFRDNWAFGYTPEFTVGVWVGNFDGTPMQNVSGVSGAAPVLHEVMEHLHARYGTTWYATPANMVECWVHPLTGKRLGAPQQTAGPDAGVGRDASPRRPGGGWDGRLGEASLPTRAPGPEAVKEKFMATTLPPLECAVDYADGALRSAGPFPDAPRLSSAVPHAVLLGGEYAEWFASGDNGLGARAVLAAVPKTLRIVFPPPGTTVYLDPDLPHQGRRLYVRAEGPRNLAWQSDSLRLSCEGTREVAQLTEGRHEITARDPETGTLARTWINVVAR